MIAYAQELAFSRRRAPARDRRPAEEGAKLQHDGAEGVRRSGSWTSRAGRSCGGSRSRGSASGRWPSRPTARRSPRGSATGQSGSMTRPPARSGCPGSGASVRCRRRRKRKANSRDTGTKGFDEAKAREPPAWRSRPTARCWPPASRISATYGGLLDVPPITLWDVAAAREVRRFAGHPRGITSLAFSPDGKTLASSGGEQVARIWDVATGREVDHRPGHPTGIQSIWSSPRPTGPSSPSGNADGTSSPLGPGRRPVAGGRRREAEHGRLHGHLAGWPDPVRFRSRRRAGALGCGRAEGAARRLTRDRMEGGRYFRPVFIRRPEGRPEVLSCGFLPGRPDGHRQ